jgi:hypothetical protein
MVDSDLSKFPLPEWSSPLEIEASLAAIRSSTDAESSQDAYNRLLYAIGNNHAGVYHPIAIAVLPSLGEILKLENKWARSSVLNALVDLCLSFEPAPEHRTVVLPNGRTADIEIALHEAATKLRPMLTALLNSPALETAEQSLATELLEWIDQGPEIPNGH